MKPECKDCAEYGSEFCADCLEEKMKDDHPNCGTPDCCGECETGNVAEEMTTTASIPNPADTAMGPRFSPKNVTDRRRKKKTVLLKRFRRYMEDNA